MADQTPQTKQQNIYSFPGKTNQKFGPIFGFTDYRLSNYRAVKLASRSHLQTYCK